jgi:hypothetical protein
MKEEDYITHVAIRYSGVVWSLPKPFRHGHIQAMVSLLWRPRMGDMKDEGQGFLDGAGRFLTREEAEAHGRKTGQILGPLIGGVLTSEDLW